MRREWEAPISKDPRAKGGGYIRVKILRPIPTRNYDAVLAVAIVVWVLRTAPMQHHLSISIRIFFLLLLLTGFDIFFPLFSIHSSTLWSNLRRILG